MEDSSIKKDAARELDTVSRQKAEDSYAGWGADEHFAVDDRWGDEFVAVAELVAAVAGLVAVVDFAQVRGVVGMQHRRAGVLDGPNNSAARAVRRDAGGCAGIAEGVGGLCGGAR